MLIVSGICDSDGKMPNTGPSPQFVHIRLPTFKSRKNNFYKPPYGSCYFVISAPTKTAIAWLKEEQKRVRDI
jgi:hypothetical protein